MADDGHRSRRLQLGPLRRGQHNFAVELVGYLDGAVGTGEAARRYVLALRSAGVGVIERNIALPGRDSISASYGAGRQARRGAVSFNLLCLNPEEMVPYLETADSPQHGRRTSVGVWSWEVDVLPDGWYEAARQVDEVWTYSSFAAERIGASIGMEVRVFPPPLHLDWRTVAPAPPRVDAGEFRVLTMFDYLSTLERKNPLAAIAAYRSAFAPGDGCQLIVKSINGQHRADHRADVEAAAVGRPDILLLDGTVASTERDSLVASCDCYLSLHRSEGFGLTLAEAMAARKPVIATAYGGNMEFMSAENSYLVTYRLTTVGDGVEHYPGAASWAEPDIAQAVQQLRAVFTDRAQARARAERGRSDVEALFAPEVVGGRMRDHLVAVHAAR